MSVTKTFFVESNNLCIKLTIIENEGWGSVKSRIEKKFQILDPYFLDFLTVKESISCVIYNDEDWKEVFSKYQDYTTLVISQRQHRGMMLPFIKSSSRLNPNLLKIGTRLGDGSFAIVYEGQWKQEKVAIKIFSQFLVDEPEKEIVIFDYIKSKSLYHENVIKYFGFVKFSYQFALVIELMNGGSLSFALRGSNPLNHNQKVECCLQIAKGLSFLHQNNILHGDLAARNCLLQSTDLTMINIKLADFGLAKLMEEKFEIKNTYIASLQWAAIELLVEQKCSRSSDVWSFGVTMWEIFTNGDEPYKGVLDVPKYLYLGSRLSIPDLDPILNEIISNSWEKDPKQRFDYILKPIYFLIFNR